MAAVIPHYRLNVALYVCGTPERPGHPVIILDRPDGGGGLELILEPEGPLFLSDYVAPTSSMGHEGRIEEHGVLGYFNERSERRFRTIGDLFEALMQGTGPAGTGPVAWSEDPQTEALGAALKIAAAMVRDARAERGYEPPEGLWQYIEQQEAVAKGVAG